MVVPKKKKYTLAGEETPPITCSGRLQLDDQSAKAVEALAAAWSKTMREVYIDCVIGNKPWFVKNSSTGKRSELVARGWYVREATAMHFTAAAMQDSAVTNTEQSVETDQANLADIQARMNKAKPKRKAYLAVRSQKLKSRIKQKQNRIDTGDVRVTFGGRKLSLAGNDPTARGYESSAHWRAVWDRARANMWYCAGDAQSPNGNYCAKIELDVIDPNTGELLGDFVTVNIPRHLQEQCGVKKLRIPIEGMNYRREDLEWALETSEKSVLARSEAKRAVSAGAVDEKGKTPTIPKVKRNAPVSVRISWKEAKQNWYVHVTCDAKPSHVVPLTAVPYVLGVDINPDHLAWALVKRDGNPVKWGKIPMSLDGTSEQNLASIGDAVAELVQVAQEYNAAIACEKLNFTKARAGLRYLPPSQSRKLSSFAYRKVLSVLASRCHREAVYLKPVDPAYSSVLGQANYAGTCGVSVDQGAGCVIARRALGFRTRVRPKIVSAMGGVTKAEGDPRAVTSPDLTVSNYLHLVKVATKTLPVRSSTWDSAGLCARQPARDPFTGLWSEEMRTWLMSGRHQPQPQTG